MTTVRMECDSLGEKAVPVDAYYGIQTLRGSENFPVTGIPISSYPVFIKAMALVKKSTAMANQELGLLDSALTGPICQACDEIISGKFLDEFHTDVLQGGGGTTANMNINEVVANRALEIMGHDKGDYETLHPNNHVNMGQSTNDAYPTSIRVALHLMLGHLLEQMGILRNSLAKKGKEFRTVIKLGRTELQDAVPMTLGQEFDAYALLVDEDMRQVKNSQDLIVEINLGATAIGTGINAHPDYAALAAKYLAECSGVPVYTAPNLIEATQDCGGYVQLSGILKRIAVKFSKICNDLRLLSSGPRGGLNEINLPKMQPGSTIMPGKVNPVIPDMMIQVCYQVIGADISITMAAQAGQLELNANEPLIAHMLFQSITNLGKACSILSERCINGITANEDVCENMVKNSIGLATALNPVIGYSQAAQVAQEAHRKGKSIYDIVLEKGILDKDELDKILSPRNMMEPRSFVLYRNSGGKNIPET